MRLVLHGFGSFPVLFWHLVQASRRRQAPVEWAIILKTDHYGRLFRTLLGSNRVLVLPAESSRRLSKARSPYPGALWRDLAAEKREYLWLTGFELESFAREIYDQTYNFMRRFRPTHALVSQIEGFDGKAFLAAARACGAEVLVPTYTRILGGFFFSRDDQESLPDYRQPLDARSRKKALRWIREFRSFGKPLRPSTLGKGQLLGSFTPPLGKRALLTLRRWFRNPRSLRGDDFRASFLNTLPLIRDGTWKLRTLLNQGTFQVRDPRQLPKRFIFFPLQYSPESSINTPAPYFLDQTRVIDAIRFAMPSDCHLVVKEHPACLLTRSGRFMRELRKTPGVVIADVHMKSRELIQRSGLVISVTGTAIFEALMLGKRAIALGGCFFSEAVGGVCTLAELKMRIATQLGKKFPLAKAVDLVAQVQSCSYPIYFGSPGIPGEPVLRDRNVEAILDAIFDHHKKLKS